MATTGDRWGRRIALYSHDAQGLGHVRRNLAIAGALSRLHPAPDVLLFTGTPEASAFTLPPGCDLVTLPALAKDEHGRYGPRSLTASTAELVGLRSAVLRAALRSFRPDVLVVDKHPRGVLGELEAALEDRRAAGGSRTVLGLRDVLDDPAKAGAEWRRQGATAALERWYDEVWVYGDPAVVDPTADLHLPDSIARTVVHTGYLSRGRIPAHAPGAAPMASPYVLGLVGGGGDGAALARAFVDSPLPAGVTGVLVTGPQMSAADRSEVVAAAAGRRDIVVRNFLPRLEPWLARASAVVAMGGYNTVCETLATDAPLLVVPRVQPRTEQLVRAQRMAALGLLDLLHPTALDPGRVGAWVARAVARPDSARGRRARARLHACGGTAEARHAIDLDGLARLGSLVTRPPGAAPARTATGSLSLPPRQENHDVAV